MHLEISFKLYHATAQYPTPIYKKNHPEQLGWFF